MKPLNFYIDTPSVRVFQHFAGESLEKLDEIEAWDVVTMLAQAVATANVDGNATIDTHDIIQVLSDGIEFSENSKECLRALHGFPSRQVKDLMVGIISVAFEV